MFRKKQKMDKRFIEIVVAGKCKNCWHWKENKDQSLTTHFGTTVMGECSCSEVYDFIWWDGDRDKSDDEVGNLFTHEGFGCNRWSKEKPY